MEENEKQEKKLGKLETKESMMDKAKNFLIAGLVAGQLALGGMYLEQGKRLDEAQSTVTSQSAEITAQSGKIKITTKALEQEQSTAKTQAKEIELKAEDIVKLLKEVKGKDNMLKAKDASIEVLLKFYFDGLPYDVRERISEYEREDLRKEIKRISDYYENEFSVRHETRNAIIKNEHENRFYRW